MRGEESQADDTYQVSTEENFPKSRKHIYTDISNTQNTKQNQKNLPIEKKKKTVPRAHHGQNTK